MDAVSTETIRSFLIQQIEHWNAGDKEAFTQLYQSVAPNGLIIEYVGRPIGDGWQAFNDMWENYNAHIRVEIGEVLVNGNEGACYYRNVRVADGTFAPSIEIYRFEGGTLHVRYFH